MSADIRYGAVVVQGEEILLLQAAIGASWSLPGGALSDGDDVDVAMADALGKLGIAADSAAAFANTLYLHAPASGEARTVFNLYVVDDWSGEPEPPIGANLGWFGVDDLAGLVMEPEMRSTVLGYFRAGDAALEAELPEPRLLHADPPGGRAGLDVLRTLSGAATGEIAAAGLRKRAGPLADDVIDFALGQVWTDPALDRKTRSLQVVAMLAALSGRPTQLRSHTNGALNHGATPDQLVQTLRMVAVYAGFPAALTAWETVREVIEARGYPLPGVEL